MTAPPSPPRSRSTFAPVLALIAVALAGCAADPALSQARSTLRSATRVVTDLEARTAEGPGAFGPEVAARVTAPASDAHWRGLHDALRAAGQRVDEAAVALDVWEEGDAGDLAWRTVVPCLALALAEARAHLEALGVPATVALDEALAMTSSSGDRCGTRRAPAER